CCYFSIRKYTTTVSHEQRQHYKDDFNAEYGEYRNLHARTESTIKRFMKLAERRKLLSPGSKEYEDKKDKTVK
ncbi:ELL2 factor, partial [Pterocles burchelli]|nr:ELL2 factor [Pterocles burchelli]